VIGYEDEETMKKLKPLYSSWDCPQIFTNSRTAEFLKYSTVMDFVSFEIEAPLKE
jgi:UDP-glucose 6-dehydrogenase